MFDWNDEELNIIWGEAGGSDDHIVPYPDQIEEKPPVLFGDYNKKELKQEISDVTPVEQKPTIRNENGIELNCSSKYETGEPAIGFGPPLLNTGKTDHDSMGSPTSDKMIEFSKSCSSKDESAQFDKESENFQNQTESKEEVDFVDYGWANIGTFDDLDKIFSNSDPIFGDSAVGNADELWSSSKDADKSPLRASIFSGDSSDLEFGQMRNPLERFETEYLDPSQSFLPDYQNLNEIAAYAPQDVQASLDTVEHSGGKSKLLTNEEKNFEMGGKSQVSSMQLNDGAAATDKGNRKKRVLKGQKLEEKSEVRQMHDLCGTSSSSGSPSQQFNMQYVPSMVNQHPALISSQLQNPEPLKHKHSSGPVLASPAYGNMVNQYPTLSVLPQFHPGEGNYISVRSGYEVSSGNANSLRKPGNTAVKPPSMTPQEKIEKLRRRQQMRAILAIQKQQQQFSNQMTENSSLEGGNVEVEKNVTSFPSLDPASPIEPDNSSTISNTVFDDCSVEASILHRLQETINNLDIQIRLCIQDSLFRLAKSAKQRQYSGDTSNSNPSSKDDSLSTNEGKNLERFTRMPDVETETNPIDRTVAHLLFHRPLELSGKPAETPESPISEELPYDGKDTLPSGYFLESSQPMQFTSPRGSKTLGIFSEGVQSKNSPCLDTSENASKTEVADRKHKNESLSP